MNENQLWAFLMLKKAYLEAAHILSKVVHGLEHTGKDLRTIGQQFTKIIENEQVLITWVLVLLMTQ